MPEEKATRKPRSDKGPRLIDRDYLALKWIAQQYSVTLDHIAILLSRLTPPGTYAQSPDPGQTISHKRALDVVNRWETMGLIKKKWIIHGQQPWIWLTNEGLRLVAPDVGELRAYTPTPATLNHFYAINQTRLIIEKKKDRIWTSEREMRRSTKITTGTLKHRPDGLVLTEQERVIAVEVEISRKTYPRLDKILLDLAINPTYYNMWYFCKGRANIVVKNAIADMDPRFQSKFVVYDLDTLATE